MSVDLNPRFSFDTFVVGASNRLAVSAARAVAEAPGTAYNPLFIYSATGLGKTHLLMAIGQAARAVTPTLSVEYLTLEEFVEALHTAVAAGQSEAFRNRFSEVDMVLVDDVQFLATRREMQAELLRLSNALQQAGHQMVLASDRAPAEIADLDERLISRLSGGLVVDIGRPEFETRLAILRRRAEQRGVGFDPGVLEAVAGIDVLNVRELLGALNRLIAFQAVSDARVTPEAVLALLTGGEEAAATPSEVGVTAPVRRPSPHPVTLVEPAAPAPPPARPEAVVPVPPAVASSAEGLDEFAEFMSEVRTTVARQVEAWKLRVSEAVVRWEGEGYRTARLSKLLDEGDAERAEASLEEFEKDVEHLRALETEMAGLDAQSAGDAVFRNPDRIAEAEVLVQRAREGATPPPGPSSAWAFDGFEAGESNRMALNAAYAIAQNPGVQYNPLVLVGGAGVGKTHLLHSIGHALSVASGALVACLSAQDFIDDLVQAIDWNRVDQWRSRYRRATAFLLDDVHLLAGKERSQEELFHLFNLLLESERQIVFTASSLPRDIPGLDDRLVSRLEAGLVAQIHPPDRELRRGIVARQLAQKLGSVDEDLANYLADRPIESVRGLLSMIQRVLRAAESTGAPPAVALARDLLEGAAIRRRRPSSGVRTSGLVVSPSGGVRSREKMVWRWPSPGDRLIEDLT